MSFFSRLFSKTPADLLAKGDAYMKGDSFFDARTCFEDGLALLEGTSDDEQKRMFRERIDSANRKLAELNIREAEWAYSRGDTVKALDHLELVRSLTGDPALNGRAESLIASYTPSDADAAPPPAPSSCGSCSGSSSHHGSSEIVNPAETLTLPEYYELLIHQLPADQYPRYARLGDEFAHAYVAASQDQHHEALAALESCSASLPVDIFCYEKGKILHRIGSDRESELSLRRAVQQNPANALAWVHLALVLRESGRFDDAQSVIDTMIADGIMPEDAVLIRADIFEQTGRHEDAMELYISLLGTPWARPAAEKLYGILMEVGRHDDAAVIFKKYLKKSCH